MLTCTKLRFWRSREEHQLCNGILVTPELASVVVPIPNMIALLSWHSSKLADENTYSPSVIHGGEQHESRIRDRLERSADDPQGGQSGEIFGDGLEPDENKVKWGYRHG